MTLATCDKEDSETDWINWNRTEQSLYGVIDLEKRHSESQLRDQKGKDGEEDYR